MDTVINRLSEIEAAAGAIVEEGICRGNGRKDGCL